MFKQSPLLRTPRRLLLRALILAMPGLAMAAGWEIDPVRIELSPERQAAAVTFRNDTDQPTSIQIQAVAWSQIDGEDNYAATRELLITPPFVTVAPRAGQVIRVALRRAADENSELAYRIILQELPPQPVAGFTGVQVALRIGLPVFVQSARGDAAPQLKWSIARLPGNMLKVGLKNTGTAHVQVSDFALFVPGSDNAITGEAGSSYVLAGQLHEWLLNTTSGASASADRLRLKGHTDAGDVEADVVFEAP